MRVSEQGIVFHCISSFRFSVIRYLFSKRLKIDVLSVHLKQIRARVRERKRVMGEKIKKE